MNNHKLLQEVNMIELWTNTKEPLKRNFKKVKPCLKCGYCPYGAMVEAFPLKDKSKLSCPVFGHDCPMYYNAEDMSPFGERRLESLKK